MPSRTPTNKRSATLLPVPVKKIRTPGVLYEDNCRGGAFIHKARDWESDCGKCHRKTVSEIFYRALRAVMYRHGCKTMAVTQAIHEIEEELASLGFARGLAATASATSVR